MAATFVNIVLLLGVLHISGCQGGMIMLSANQMCTHALPRKGKICRAIQDCSLPRYPPRSRCLPKRTFLDCVPKGIDDVCKAKKLRAVLQGPTKDPYQLKPMLCNRRGRCPIHATCYKGHCCYNDYKPTVKHPACPWCDLPCPPEYSCQKVKASCGHAYACLPKHKPGYCPFDLKQIEDCSKVKVAHLCKDDDNCKDNLKCCEVNSCGGKTCTKPEFFGTIFGNSRK